MEYIELGDGAVLRFCGLDCALEWGGWHGVDAPTPTQGIVNHARAAWCQHCAECGSLITAPDAGCPRHPDGDCPDRDWARTRVGLDYLTWIAEATGSDDIDERLVHVGEQLADELRRVDPDGMDGERLARIVLAAPAWGAAGDDLDEPLDV